MRKHKALIVVAFLVHMLSGPDSARAGSSLISEVRLSGVSAEVAIGLKTALATRKGHDLRASAIAADVKRLWKLGRFSDVQAEFDRDSGRVEFSLTRLPIVSSIRFVNLASGPKESTLRDLVELSVGQPLSPAAIRAAELRLAAYYASHGYPRASVRIRSVPTASNSSASLHVDVNASDPIDRVSFNFVGNRDQTDEQLRGLLEAALKSTAEGELNAQLENQRQRLVSHYHSRGFAEVRIDRPLRGHKASERTRAIGFRINEGDRYAFGEVSVPADHGSPIVPSGLFDVAAVTALTSRLANSLRQQGYAFAQVSPALTVDHERREIDVRFVVNRGLVATVERVEIRGNSKTRDSVIRRELDVEIGERLTSSAIARSVASLERLGFFDQVSAEVHAGSHPGDAVVAFTVEERMTGQFVLGAGFSSSSGLSASASIGQSNLFGRGHRLNMLTRLSERESIFVLRFRNPSLFDSDWSASAEIYNTSQKRPGSTREAVGGAITVGHNLTDTLRASLTGRLEQVTAIEPDEIAAAVAFRTANGGVSSPELYRDGLIASLRGTVAFDDRRTKGPLPQQSRLGTHMGVYGEIATNLVESGGSFQRLGAWIDHHQALASASSARFRGNVDWIGSGDRQGVPLFERFFAGGMHDVRGYAPLSLGASIFTSSGASGDPLRELALGGNLRILASAELSFPIASAVGLSGVVFADAGNVFNLERRYCRAASGSNACPSAAEILTGMRASVGVGARWQSPLGPLRFEWGVPLTRRPSDPPVRFHFGFGPS